MVAAEEQINHLIAANRRTVVGRWIQGVIILALTIVVVILVFLYTNQRQQAIANCHAGNDFKVEQTQIWDEFISIALQGNKNPAAYTKGKLLEQYVSKTDAPRSCS